MTLVVETISKTIGRPAFGPFLFAFVLDALGVLDVSVFAALDRVVRLCPSSAARF